MAKSKAKEGSEALCQTVVLGMQELKAEEIVIVDLKKMANSIASYFVLCSGNSDRHTESISESVQKVVEEKLGDEPWKIEGRTNKEWILLDYADVVVHIFQKDKREFYGLETLWGDAEMTHVESPLQV